MKNKKLIQALYKVICNDLADKLHTYPDEVWNLLAEWYYHTDIEILMDDTIIEDDDGFKPFLGDLKAKYKTDDFEAIQKRLGKEHSKRADDIRSQIEKKWPEIEEDLEDIVLGSQLINKFDKWMWRKDVFNPLGDPKKPYLDV